MEMSNRKSLIFGIASLLLVYSSMTQATVYVPIVLGDITIVIPIEAPTLAIQFSDSGDAQIYSTDSAILRVNASSQITKIEFNLNGQGWVTATLVNGQYQYDFGQLGIGSYHIQVRINNLHVQSYTFTVVSPPIMNLKNALVQYEYDDSGRLVLVKVNGKIVIDYRLDAAENRTQIEYKEVK